MSLVTRITALAQAVGAAVKADRLRLTALEALPPGVLPATVAPLMDGAAAVGTTTKYAREDHRHPTDTVLVRKDGTTPFTAAQTGVAATASTQLTTYGQFVWPNYRASFSQSVPTRRIWTGVSALTAIANNVGTAMTVAGGTITIVDAGVYSISAFALHPTVNSLLGMRIMLNGAAIAGDIGAAQATINTYASGALVCACAANDTITIQLDHDVAAAVTVTGQISISRIDGLY
jgi:hypothetical protein